MPQADQQDQQSQADAGYRDGDFEQATVLYQAILARAPERLDIIARLGRLALLRNDPPAAIDYFAVVLNRGWRAPQHWQDLAEAYLANAQWGEAAWCFERAGRTGLAGALAVLAQTAPYRLHGTASAGELAWLPGVSLPLVSAQVNGMAANLLLDTAAGDLLLDAKFAIAAELPHGGTEQREFAGGLPAMVTYGHAHSLGLGPFTLRDVLVQVLDLPASLSAHAAGLPVHGIVGLAVLSRFSLTLDYRRRQLRLQLPGTDDDCAAAARGSRFWLADQQFILARLEMPDGASDLWVIDSGMGGAAFALAADRQTPAVAATEQGWGGGGAVEGQRLLAGLRLDGLERRDVDGMALASCPLTHRFGFRVRGLLGSDFFHQTALSLDFSRMRLNAR